MRDVYEVFREVAEGVFESPSITDLMKLTSISEETREMMARIMTGEFNESSSPTRDNGSDATGTLDDASSRLDEMSEKYDFLKIINADIAADQIEGNSPTSVLQDMLELMQSGEWSELSMAGADGEMPDDMPSEMPGSGAGGIMG